MKVVIVGGDGFCGWPTSLHLAKNGYDILIIDNLSRREIDNQINSNSLTNIASIDERISYANRNNFKVMLNGGLSGVISWLFIFPFDTIKTNMQQNNTDFWKTSKSLIIQLLQS